MTVQENFSPAVMLMEAVTMAYNWPLWRLLATDVASL